MRKACKPDFVPQVAPVRRPFIWARCCHLALAANPNLSGQSRPAPISPRGSANARFLFGVAPGGACHAGAVASPPVVSYSTVSPLPQLTRKHAFRLQCGGLFSVALSVRLPCPGVTRHRCFTESGLSSPFGTAVQPSARARTKSPNARRQPLKRLHPAKTLQHAPTRGRCRRHKDEISSAGQRPAHFSKISAASRAVPTSRAAALRRSPAVPAWGSVRLAQPPANPHQGSSPP